MKSLIELCKSFETEYKAAKHFKIHQQQLQRWLKSDAHIDEKGNVYIKTKGVINND
ncbi:MAG: hypothetical protein GY920_09390 [Aliivibrio sp.]|nr:hypothetical protein [Aliivibrio sp.]